MSLVGKYRVHKEIVI